MRVEEVIGVEKRGVGANLQVDMKMVRRPYTSAEGLVRTEMDVPLVLEPYWVYPLDLYL